MAEARAGIGAYLRFYNSERPHQTLDYRTPAQVFEVDPVSWTELWRSQVRVLALLSAEPENHAYQL